MTPFQFLLEKQFYSFHRPFYERNGYEIRRNEDGSDLVFINALGIDPKDIEVSVTKEYGERHLVKISGNTHDEKWDEDFSVNLVLISKLVPISKITKSFSNGLLILKIEYQRPVQPDVEIVEA